MKKVIGLIRLILLIPAIIIILFAVGIFVIIIKLDNRFLKLHLRDQWNTKI